MRFFLIYFFFLPLTFFSQSFSRYVNPFIGTGGHGHTFPGAVVPFGMVQLSPDTRVDGSWDGCGGYHYSDSLIYGFSHTHLSGVGINDFGDVLTMPLLSKTNFTNTEYRTSFSHKNEKASPAYYEVKLNSTIKVELTATARVGIQRYTFPKDSSAKMIVDLLHRDKLLKGNIKLIDSVTIVGFRISKAWANEQHCYFAMRFSQPIKRIQFGRNNGKINVPNYAKGEFADACFIEFKTKNNEPLVIKTAISATDNEGALTNLNTEAKYWEFEKYKREAEKLWEAQLSKIQVESKDETKLINFYTALYHCFIHPSVFQDADGRYRGLDSKIHIAKNYTHYTVFSLWDTYRALHPLFSLIEQKRTTDFINTFAAQYADSKRLPMWELAANETDCMIGFHSVSVIADCFAKQIGGFDTTVIYDAMRTSAAYPKYGLDIFNKKGYLQIDDESESVSKTLEYAYDHWCIAQVAQKLKKEKDYRYHLKLSLGYKNLFDASSHLMRPRTNGNWLSPFDAKQLNNNYTEANAWQYSFYVPQDVEGLIKLHGGEKNFEAKLDELFTTSSDLNGKDVVDITGLIGQYAHGNEPSHHAAYLYNFIGKPQKTIQCVHQILNTFYTPTPDGLIGNDDCGQLSAWYVMSAMGLYPVCPGSNQYVLGAPIFDKIKWQLENGKTFVMDNTSKNKGIINSYKLNGSPVYRSAINHQSIIEGGEMIWQYSNATDSAIVKYGKSVFMRPTSRINNQLALASPLISSNTGKSIFDKATLQINSNESKNINTVYTLDGTEPTRRSELYFKPITISKSCIIKTRNYSKTDSSSVNEARFIKSTKTFSIELKSVYNKQYNAGGVRGLSDSIFGDLDWRKGDWQGYQSQDFECIVDLKALQAVRYIGAHVLQDTRAWIIYPSKVNFYFSKDGKNWTLQESVEHTVKPDDYTTQTQWLEKQLPKPETTRYVKIVANNFGKLPAWHQGFGPGGDALIFIDEVDIR